MGVPEPTSTYYVPFDEATVTIEALGKAYNTQPFRPFAIRLADGRTLPVPHPEHLAFSQKSRTAVVMDDDGGFEVVDLLLVVGLSFEVVAAAS